jgi:branched-chain amino acid transport system substrate-binding protein
MTRAPHRWTVMLAMVLVGLCRAAHGAEDPVRIAYLAPLSGSLNVLGFEEWLKNFRAAVDEVNARGGVLGGRKLEIVAFDNKGSPQETMLVFKQVTDQNIRYVATTISSVALALSDAVAKHNARNPERPVLFLDYDAREPSLTESKCNFWHFRFHPHSDMQINVLTDYIARQPAIRRLYLINQDYAWGHSVTRAVLEMLGRKRPDIQIVGNDLVPLGKVKDFSPYVAKIGASGADAVLTGNWGNDLSLLIRAAHDVNLKTAFYTTHAWALGTPAAIGAAGADRVRTVMQWHINEADAAWQKRLLAYREKYKAQQYLDYLPIWQTIEMFAAAIERAKSVDPVRVGYALEGMDFAGPSGRSWMRPDDHQVMAPIYVTSFVKAGQPGVKYETEGTGFGFKTEVKVDADKNVPRMVCEMERPAR